MTTAQVAQHLDARRVSPGRYMSLCPAHPDRSPSLSIREGAGGRTLVHDFAGCTLTAILAASGLHLRDLFPGPPPSPAERRKAEAARSAQRRKSRARSRAVGVLSDDVRRLHIAANHIGATLAVTDDDDASGDALALRYHETLAWLREAERKLDRQ